MKTVTFTTNKGTLTAELYEAEAPGTVANFEKLVKSGFYDGIVFHRVIPDFVVQGGDPLTKTLPLTDRTIGTGGPGWQIKCETRGNPHTHKDGALSMAHAGKDTGGSQFFIVLSEGNTRHLNGVHTVFGQVTEGLDVVHTLEKGDKIEKATIGEA
ncbi:MAG: peptidyl-prolyl cis-trans isomerase [Gemmatimonadetes bacterium]|nr:peptidyl-prolyl cis-trans isomerase [Gemmatimonadota bacterium]